MKSWLILLALTMAACATNSPTQKASDWAADQIYSRW